MCFWTGPQEKKKTSKRRMGGLLCFSLVPPTPGTAGMKGQQCHFSSQKTDDSRGSLHLIIVPSHDGGGRGVMIWGNGHKVVPPPFFCGHTLFVVVVLSCERHTPIYIY